MKEIPTFKFKSIPLSEDQSEFLIRLATNLQMENWIDDLNDTLKKEFLCQILMKRIKAYNLPFRISNFFFMISVSTFADNPGKAMIMLRLCYQHWKKTGCTDFNLDVWCKDMFPLGIPSEESMQEWWDSQKDSKAPLGNLVDDYNNWR